MTKYAILTSDWFRILYIPILKHLILVPTAHHLCFHYYLHQSHRNSTRPCGHFGEWAAYKLQVTYMKS